MASNPGRGGKGNNRGRGGGNVKHPGGSFDHQGLNQRFDQSNGNSSGQSGESVNQNPVQRKHRRLRRPQNKTIPIDNSLKKNINKEKVNQLAEVLVNIFSQNDAVPSLNFIHEAANNFIDDDDKDDDTSSLYSYVSDKGLSQADDLSYGLSQDLYFNGGRNRGKSQDDVQKGFTNVYPKIALFWDIENCAVPKGKSALHFVKRVRDIFCNGHTEDKFVIVCDTTKQKASVIEDLNAVMVRTEHVSGSAKNAADECLRRNMREFAENNIPPATIVLITGDLNFNAELHDMLYRRHFNVILVHNRQTSEALKMCASECHSFEEISSDLPDRITNGSGPVNIRVTNLPKGCAIGKIKGRLHKLMANFGGKIIKLPESPTTAIVQFPSSNNANRARSSLQGEDVHGSKIKLYIIANGGFKLEVEEPLPPEKKQAEPTEANPCFVSFCVTGYVNFKDMEDILRSHLANFEKLTLMSRESGKSCYNVQSCSLSAARKMVKTLNQIKSPVFFDVQVVKAKSDLNADPLLETCQKTKQSYLDKHNNVIKELKARLLYLNTIRLKSGTCNPLIEDELKAIISRINLMVSMEREFQDGTNQVINAVKQYGGTDKDLLTKLLAECQFLSGASPVYGYRKDIVNSFLKNSVTVLTGHSGCGKSSQVVQFIFQALMDVQCRIVVTEPDKALVASVGNIVATQMKQRIGKAAGVHPNKVIYLTDMVFLAECFLKQTLEGYTHVIIDEAQQRTLATEILLAHLKTVTRQRSDLHLLVIATPDRGQQLSQFFNGCPLVHVALDLYPVEKIWQKPTQNYIRETVDIAFKVLMLEKTGDVIAFLPNPSDVNYATLLMGKKLEEFSGDVAIRKLLLQFHFKTSYKEIRQSDRRQIIFTTGDVETIIAVPNVRFVIDCGFMTEIGNGITHHSLETKPVSQTCAEFRTTKAGLCVAGKCYRLYTIDSLMTSQTGGMNCDIERLVLCVLTLRMNPAFFDYVDPPSHNEVESALRSLVSFDAVTCNKAITETGRKMATIPLDVHLSSLLLDGVSQQIGYLALCFCAIASTFSVFTVLSSENTSPPSKGILRTMEEFMEWVKLTSANRQKFEVNRRINPEAMEVINERVTDLHEALKVVGVNIKLRQGDPDWQLQLKKLLGKRLRQNICIIQRPSDNAYSWTSGKKIVTLLPALSHSQVLMEMVVFESIWKNQSGEFMGNVVHLEEDCWDKVEGLDQLAEQLRAVKQEVTVIHPLGHHVMRTELVGANGGKKIQWEKMLSELVMSPVNLAVFQNKGDLKVYCPKVHKTRILEELQKAIQLARDVMEGELWEFCICKNTGVRIVWGKMAKVSQFLLLNDFMSIVVFAVPIVSTAYIVQHFQKHGQIVHHSEKTNVANKKQVVIMFANPKCAVHATRTKSKDFSVKPRLMNVNRPPTSQTFLILTLSWTRRLNVGTAVVALDGILEWGLVSYKLTTQRQGSCFEDAEIEYDVDLTRLLLRNLNKTVSKAELEADIAERIPIASMVNVQLTLQQGFSTSPEELMKKKNVLKSLLSPYGVLSFVEVAKPADKDETWTASVGFRDLPGGQVAVDLIRRLTIDGCRLTCKMSHSCSAFCSVTLMSLIQDAFVSKLEKRKKEMQGKSRSLKVTMDTASNDRAEIKFESQSMEELAIAFKTLGDNLVGHSFDMSQYCLRDDFFVDEGSGMNLLHQLAKRHKGYLNHKKYANRIVVVGKRTLIVEIEENLQLEVAKLSSLDSKNLPCGPGVIRELVQAYQPSLSKFKEVIDAKQVKLDIKSHSVVIWGDHSVIMKARAVLTSIEATLRSKTVPVQPSPDICPVCMDDIQNAEQNYRMEYCGHAYCYPCMSVFIANSNPPVRCIYQNCDRPIVFRDLTTLQKELPIVIRDLADRATALYLGQNGSEYYFCPLPDCDGILRLSEKQDVCPDCFNKLCTRCDSIYHFGESCVEYQRSRRDDTPLPFDNKQQIPPPFPATTSPLRKPNPKELSPIRSTKVKDLSTQQPQPSSSQPKAQVHQLHTPSFYEESIHTRKEVPPIGPKLPVFPKTETNSVDRFEFGVDEILCNTKELVDQQNNQTESSVSSFNAEAIESKIPLTTVSSNIETESFKIGYKELPLKSIEAVPVRNAIDWMATSSRFSLCAKEISSVSPILAVPPTMESKSASIGFEESTTISSGIQVCHQDSPSKSPRSTVSSRIESEATLNSRVLGICHQESPSKSPQSIDSSRKETQTATISSSFGIYHQESPLKSPIATISPSNRTESTASAISGVSKRDDDLNQAMRSRLPEKVQTSIPKSVSLADGSRATSATIPSSFGIYHQESPLKSPVATISPNNGTESTASKRDDDLNQPMRSRLPEKVQPSIPKSVSLADGSRATSATIHPLRSILKNPYAAVTEELAQLDRKSETTSSSTIYSRTGYSAEQREPDTTTDRSQFHALFNYPTEYPNRNPSAVRGTRPVNPVSGVQYQTNQIGGYARHSQTETKPEDNYSVRNTYQNSSAVPGIRSVNPVSEVQYQRNRIGDRHSQTEKKSKDNCLIM